MVKVETTDREFDGYVIYSKNSEKIIPYGVVSDNYECNAKSDYIPNQIKNFLIQIEDKRFFEHQGIDFKGISRAIIKNIKARKIIQGGSTITQQLARNLLKDNRKTFTRKLKEAFKAIYLEHEYSKDQIINLYFNNIYFGKNLRGIRTAGLYYFGKEIEQLNQKEFLYLLTILRGPNYYINKPEKIAERYLRINNLLYQEKLISKNRKRENKNIKFEFRRNELQNINSISIPFIAEKIYDKQRKILSTIEVNIQNFAKQFVSNSRYPVSIIIIKNNKIVSFASHYGMDYPFISKMNVGSTLKPFLYCYLRDNGVSKEEKFDAIKNVLDWKVREVSYYKPILNLEEALFYSNNNAFINAANKVSINNTLSFLSKIFDKNRNDFFPSSILGATKNGISLFELASTYSNFFFSNNISDSKLECLAIMNKIFTRKLGFTIYNAFLKTGTTNNNKERYCILGKPNIVFAMLQNKIDDKLINSNSKEGNFLNYIKENFLPLFKGNNYSWI